MKKPFLSAIFLCFTILIVAIYLYNRNLQLQRVNTGAPPYGVSEEQVPNIDPYQWIRDWKRPEGPPKVGLQVGHWKSSEAPDELENLRNNTGTSGGGKWEWEVNLKIAQETARILEQNGIQVDILPTTIPEDYWADAFISIHADGNTNRSVNGYKVASPWRDWSRKSNILATFIEDAYGETTKFIKDPNISRNMRGYYAFSWWRYDHAIHPVTPATIVETGFLTNWSNQQLLIYKPEIAAQGIANGIINFLDSQELLSDSGDSQ